LEQFEGAEGEARLMKHLRTLYSRRFVASLKVGLARWRKVGLEGEEQRRLGSYTRRMADLAWFMKQLKEGFNPSFLRLCSLASQGGCRYRG